MCGGAGGGRVMGEGEEEPGGRGARVVGRGRVDVWLGWEGRWSRVEGGGVGGSGDGRRAGGGGCGGVGRGGGVVGSGGAREGGRRERGRGVVLPFIEKGLS